MDLKVFVLTESRVCRWKESVSDDLKQCKTYSQCMTVFQTPTDLAHNRGLIADPAAFAREAGAASWLFLCGEEFASMEGGMSYADVEAAVPESANVVSDPPRVMDMDLARRQVAALEELPRPTLVTCRTGPRSSALIYLYAGLRADAPAQDVLARADEDGAPFCQSDELRAWVAQGLEELS
jgi:hypothetical protein